MKSEPGVGSPVQAEERKGRKSRPSTQSREAERKEVAKQAGQLSGKAAIDFMVPVLKTDTGGRGENPKAGGRSIVKELGKKAP